MNLEMSAFAHAIYQHKYAMKTGDQIETWKDTARRVATNVMGAIGLSPEHPDTVGIMEAIYKREFMPGGRYLYASGRPYHQTQNCVLCRVEDSREGWADMLRKAAMSLQTGAGLGADYSDIRARGAIIRRTGGVASGPIELMKMVNEVGRGVMQGGSRRSAIWAGLNWAHGDIDEFITVKDWSLEIRAAKEKDFNSPAPLDMTNISIGLDDDFFAAVNDPVHPDHAKAASIYGKGIAAMFRHGEPGFSINVGAKRRETLRNACTEVTSEDDSDICNLGSINLSRIHEVARMREVVRLGTLFLLAGTIYSDVPYPEIEITRTKNRRLGLGLMGVHEWLLTRGLRYQPNASFGHWLEAYTESSDWGTRYASDHGLTAPVATRAIAPTGTIGIVGETTTGIEPIFCVAYKRRYLTNGKDWKFQYVIDPTAKRLVEQGVNPDEIEDAYSLSLDLERRVAFQAWMQGYVDQAISSTINMPSWGSAANNEGTLDQYGKILLRYLPQIRGITVYPDGARGGQPLVPVTYNEAVGKEGVVFEESEERCVGGACGT